MINHGHSKTQRTAPGDALTNAAHAQNAERGAMNVGTRQQVVTPGCPLASAQVCLAFCDAPGRGHHQRKAKVSGGFRQHVGGVGGHHAGGGHGRQVKVVGADCHVGANFQIGASCQQRGVNAVAAGGQRALLASQAPGQFRRAPGFVVLVGRHLKMVRQARQHLRKYRVNDQNFRFCHFFRPNVLVVQAFNALVATN